MAKLAQTTLTKMGSGGGSGGTQRQERNSVTVRFGWEQTQSWRKGEGSAGRGRERQLSPNQSGSGVDREELRSARRVSSSLSDELEVESDGWKVGGSELEEDSDELKRSDSWSSCVCKVVNPLAGIPSRSP